MSNLSKPKGKVLVGLVGGGSGPFDREKPNDNKDLGQKVGLVGQKQQPSRARAKAIAVALIDEIFDAMATESETAPPVRADGKFTDIERTVARRILRKRGLR